MPYPWDRQPNETGPAYAAFLIYRDLGLGRSLDQAHNIRSKQKGTKDAPKSGRFGSWSIQHAWVERCRTWDNHVQTESDKQQIERARRWQEKREKAREKAFDIGVAILSRTEKLLESPTVEMSMSKDGKTTILKPASWIQRDIAVMAKIALDLIETASSNALPFNSKPKDLDDVETLRTHLDAARFKLPGKNGTP